MNVASQNILIASIASLNILTVNIMGGRSWALWPIFSSIWWWWIILGKDSLLGRSANDWSHPSSKSTKYMPTRCAYTVLEKLCLAKNVIRGFAVWRHLFRLCRSHLATFCKTLMTWSNFLIVSKPLRNLNYKSFPLHLKLCRVCWKGFIFR